MFFRRNYNTGKECTSDNVTLFVILNNEWVHPLDRHPDKFAPCKRGMLIYDFIVHILKENDDSNFCFAH